MNYLLEAIGTEPGASAEAVTAGITGGQAISYGIYVFAAITLLFGLYLGFRRGFSKTVIRIVTVIAAAAISFFVAMSITGAIDTLFAGKTLEEAILSVYPSYETAVDADTREIIASFDAETAQLILDVVIAILLSPVIFILVFYVLKAVFFIVYWIIGAILGISSKHKGFFSTVFGGIMGLVQGAVVALVVLLPIAGFLHLAGEARDDMINREELSAESAEKVEAFYTDWLDDSIANPLITGISEYGGKDLFARLTSATVEGEEWDMREKAVLLAGVGVDLLDLKGMDWKAPTPDQQSDIECMVHRMATDDYMSRVLAGMLRGSSYALANNVDAFGVEEPFKSLFVEAFAVFHDSDSTNVDGDLATMLHIYFIMADHDILVLLEQDDIEGLKSKLTVKDDSGVLLIDVITDELHANPRTDKLITLFTKLSISIMADQLNLDAETAETYENVKTGLNEVLAIDKESFETEEEYREAVNESVSTTLESNGIYLEDDIVEGMSDYIADNYSDVEEITDQELNDIILSYYSSYVDYLEKNPGAELPDGIPEDILGGNTEGGENNGETEIPGDNSENTENGEAA